MYPKNTPEAQLLKRELEKRGLTVKDEVFDGHKHIDLVIHRARLNIEVDGKQHYTSARQILSDLNRMYYSDNKGYGTFHVPNDYINDPECLQKVADAIAQAARVRVHKLGYRLPYHHYQKRTS
ncbi:MAG TPA: DUF559 domain-containing protein [Candidatus Paceibacterota bacterium]|jgi:very-short-patch-repair endonuclease|nr:DUF559 domain-containing protein [Candidatus Paceibacterota bacterium]